jgi:polyhydroxyalkanoate synthesis regulator phasin
MHGLMTRMTTNKGVKLVVGAAAVSVLVAGLGAVGAVAASRTFSPAEERQAVIDDAARQLGVAPAALSDALTQALKNRVDEAVEAGRLTEAQGARLKERIDAGGVLPFFGMHPGAHGPGHARLFGSSLTDAAAYLGLTEAELRERLADETLAEIAKEEGKSVDGLVRALTTAAAKRIDEAVAAGRLTAEQATALKAELDDRIEALVNGEHRGHGGAFDPRFGHHGMPRGPPLFGGPHV